MNEPGTSKTLAPGELNALLKDAPPSRDDDTPVLMGQTGPRRRATPEELRVFAEEEWRRYAAKA